MKLSKCTFCAQEIPCLGDYIGRDDIRMDPDKIRCIVEWPTPRTKCELQSFLGTCVYVLKYCPDFASLSEPLTEVTKGKTKHEEIALDEEQHHCFQELKKRLSAPPVLSHPDSSHPFHVKTHRITLWVDIYSRLKTMIKNESLLMVDASLRRLNECIRLERRNYSQHYTLCVRGMCISSISHSLSKQITALSNPFYSKRLALNVSPAGSTRSDSTSLDFAGFLETQTLLLTLSREVLSYRNPTYQHTSRSALYLCSFRSSTSRSSSIHSCQFAAFFH